MCGPFFIKTLMIVSTVTMVEEELSMIFLSQGKLFSQFPGDWLLDEFIKQKGEKDYRYEYNKKIVADIFFYPTKQKAGVQ